jgi:hypothetical protein
VAERRPLVLVSGQPQELPDGDAVPLESGGTGATTAAGALTALGAIPKPSTGLTEQTTLADSDQFALQESGGTVKKTLWSTIKSAITALLGTAAFKNTGTSGNTVPLLDGTNTYSATQRISALVIGTGNGTSSGNGIHLQQRASGFSEPFTALDGTGSARGYFGVNNSGDWYFRANGGSATGSDVRFQTSGSISSVGLYVNGFTKLGESAPNIKCKKLAFQVPATIPTYHEVSTGVSDNKILGVSVLIDHSGYDHGVCPGDNNLIQSGLEYSVFSTSSAIRIYFSATNSGTLASKYGRILVWYEE